MLANISTRKGDLMVLCFLLRNALVRIRSKLDLNQFCDKNLTRCNLVDAVSCDMENKAEMQQGKS